MINFDSPANQHILAHMQRIYLERPHDTEQRLQEVKSEWENESVDDVSLEMRDLLLGRISEIKELEIKYYEKELNYFREAVEKYPDLKNAPVLRSDEVDKENVGPQANVVVYMWETLSSGIAPGCACTIPGTRSALLVHPTTGVIFGYAPDRDAAVLLRLPESELAVELTNPGSASQEIDGELWYRIEFGPHYSLPSRDLRTLQALCKQAFEYAGTLTHP